MINHWVGLIGILLYFPNCGADCPCEQKMSLYYLDAAVDLIHKAKQHLPSRHHCENLTRNAVDCSEKGYKKNGVYTVWPQSRVVDGKPLEVYCDMETDGGGWTLIQRRESFGNAGDYFYKDWESYKEGFGDIEKEFWLGNDNIFALTNQRLYSARFDLKTLNNETIYAHYDKFWIDDEYNKYRLHIADYTGDAGDAMAHHDNQKFSTKGEDNDNEEKGNCGEEFKGGWWYNACYHANLNGLYRYRNTEYSGIRWLRVTRRVASLQSSEIKIRPRNFKLRQELFKNTPL